VMYGTRFDASRDVGRISSPTLVIHGADDRYVPVTNAAALAEAIPGARLRVLGDAGHLIFIERAEDVNEEIVSFLEPRKEVPALGKLKEWTRRRIPGGLTSKLHGRLSR
jgi:pimeloyl-ACP methyl ester carboxylesterase